MLGCRLGGEQRLVSRDLKTVVAQAVAGGVNLVQLREKDLPGRPLLKLASELRAITGQLFYSRNDGDSWELLLEHLPPINSVDCAAVV